MLSQVLRTKILLERIFSVPWMLPSICYAQDMMGLYFYISAFFSLDDRTSWKCWLVGPSNHPKPPQNTPNHPKRHSKPQNTPNHPKTPKTIFPIYIIDKYGGGSASGGGGRGILTGLVSVDRDDDYVVQLNR